jgi:hypothetical protein
MRAAGWHPAGSRSAGAQHLHSCRGHQRMGIFFGSGVGKSVLLSMLARNVVADVSIIGLIGGRGREVQEFLEDDLGDAGLARSVEVVSTSDEPALMRRQAAHVTLAIAEYFRDEAWTQSRALPWPSARSGFRRRAADRQGLYADGLHRIAAVPRTGRAWHRPASLRCWSTATTITNRLRTRCAASLTAISSWSAPSPSAAVTLQSTCLSRCRAPCRARPIPNTCRSSIGPARSWRPCRYGGAHSAGSLPGRDERRG